MNENKITSQFALCPYLCPEPRELQPDLDFKIEDTYKTLITTTPAKEDQSRRFRDKLFHELETNLSKIYNFQDKICTNFENDQYNIHGGSLPIFLQKLCDPSVAISTILPVPQMENIDFSELFEHIIVVRIPPDRASWVVHHFMFQCKFTKSQTTDFIKSYEPIPTNLNDYFVKLIYSLYSKNLVHRNSILEWLIEKFHPAHMSPFRTEIFNSYRHLLMVLNSPLMVGYFEMLNSELLFKPSQIVHLLITIEYYLPESKERLENVIFRFANNQILSRAGSILKVIKNDFISFYSNVHRIISLNFPYFDIPSLLSEFQQLIYFSTNNEQTSEMIELFSLVIDFPNEHESIAAVLVEFIKQFRIKFPLEKFVHFLFSLK
ncbi:hypothetical protein TRFO_03852 [Tritrichomonas foetus]|uniref:Uncharacterized protein n=1 Tax=Tritrichomonas foetus TaxID=1144522 RepID=A0A1J4KL34_9EUKA|nr:hypothetical protein TRFO_03852 [Tritrichomonas foetus]|eukprot:OHT11648.1 hypothetical protein TRFO_03852 [Tritrichomonas foetus]